MCAFIKFNKGMLRMPVQWQLWLLALVALNLVVPLFFVGRLEARVVVVTLLASMTLMTALTARFGFTRIVGAGHVLWVPMLYFLWTRLDQIPADSAFGVWIRVLMTLNPVSLVIDAVDVTRYIGGDREEAVSGP